VTEAPTARTVVIAEDETLIRKDLAEMLAEEGYDVVGQAGDGQKAIELAEELRPDLVILDVKMPVLDGIAAAEAIAGRRIAPVVMLTAFSQRDLVERARAAGAMSYLVKPFSQTDLVPAIEMAVSRFAEIKQLEAEVEDLQERLATRKAVERAKGRRRSGGSRRPPWTCGCPCGRSPRASSATACRAVAGRRSDPRPFVPRR
jgi:response regulator NasT